MLLDLSCKSKTLRTGDAQLLARSKMGFNTINGGVTQNVSKTLAEAPGISADAGAALRGRGRDRSPVDRSTARAGAVGHPPGLAVLDAAGGEANFK